MPPDYTDKDIQYYHNQILENCLWLFGREVKVITFHRSDAYQALVFWKTASLNELSTVEGDLNKEVLFKGSSAQSVEAAVRNVLLKTQGKIGKVLMDDPVTGGLSVNKSEVPPQPKDSTCHGPFISLVETSSLRSSVGPMLKGTASRGASLDVAGCTESGGAAHPTNTSRSSTTTTNTEVEFLERNQKLIRDEVNLAIKRLLGNLVDQIVS